jgi:hypothetical protein
MAAPILKPNVLALVALCVLALAACEKGKPRHLPFDPMATAPPPPVAAPPPSEGISAGLPKRLEAAGFTIDSIGSAVDPLNRQPAVTSAARPIVVQGFAFDPASKAPGKGVDVMVDDKAYGTTYGGVRQDVARYFKTASLAPVGFTTAIPAGALAVGPHMAWVRVVAADGKGYFDGKKIAFSVN